MQASNSPPDEPEVRHALAPRPSFGARALSFGAELASWVFSYFSLLFDLLRSILSSVLDMPSSLLGSAMPASTSAAALHEALENAGRLIDRQLQEDRMYPDLSELLMVSAPSE